MWWIHRGLHPPPARRMQRSFADTVSHHVADAAPRVTKRRVIEELFLYRPVSRRAQRLIDSPRRGTPGSPVRSRRLEDSPAEPPGHCTMPLGSHLPLAMVTAPPRTSSSLVSDSWTSVSRASFNFLALIMIASWMCKSREIGNLYITSIAASTVIANRVQRHFRVKICCELPGNSDELRSPSQAAVNPRLLVNNA